MQTSLLQRGLQLEYATLGWNVVGSVVVLIAAARGVQPRLSLWAGQRHWIFSSVVVVWQLMGLANGRDRPALKLIGTAFMPGRSTSLSNPCGYCWPVLIPHLRDLASPGWRRHTRPYCCWHVGMEKVSI